MEKGTFTHTWNTESPNLCNFFLVSTQKICLEQKQDEPADLPQHIGWSCFFLRKWRKHYIFFDDDKRRYKAIGQNATFSELFMAELDPVPKRIDKLPCLFAAILDHKYVEKSLIFSRDSLLCSSLFWDSISNICLSSSVFLEMFSSSWNYFPFVLWIFLLQNLLDPGIDLSAVLIATGWELIWSCTEWNLTVVSSPWECLFFTFSGRSRIIKWIRIWKREE